MKPALRALVRRRGFTAACVLVLALGIGANTAVFSVAYSVLLKPLPYDNPDRIVALHEVNQRGGLINVSRLDFQDWKRQAQSFAAMGYYTGETASVFVNNSPQRLQAHAVSAGWFNAMGVSPAIGRLFAPDEQQLNAARVAVISDRFWRSAYGARRNAVGSTLKLDGDVYTIIGVLPPEFRFPGKTDIWIPLELLPDDSTRSAHNFEAIARLRNGVTLENARAELSTIAARLAAEHPDSNRNIGAAVVPLHTELSQTARPSLLVLLSAAAGVLLIACANVANLLLAQALGRQRELAVRAALGAARARILRQLLLESGLLAAAGCVLGALLAWWINDVLASLGPPSIVQSAGHGFGLAVFLFSVGVSAISVLLFGLAPALRSARLDLSSALKQGGARTSPGPGEGRLRSVLVISEIALTIALAVAAGLTARSLLALERTSPGYDTHNMLVMDFSIPGATDAERARSISAYQDVLRRTRLMPGVIAASATRHLPLGGRNSNGLFGIDGGEFREDVYAGFNVIAPEYFRTMRIPIVAGREFTDADDSAAPAVAIVSEALARRYFPGRSPIGHTILTGFDWEKRWMTIVGVASDTRNRALQTAPQPEIYMPFMQHPVAAPDMTVIVRAASDPRAYIAPLRRELAAIDREVPVEFDTLEEMRARSIGSPRFRTALLGAFAALALILASIGVYAVMSFVIARRTAEMALRIALGAERAAIFRLAIGRAAKLGIAGAASGLGIAWLVTRGMQNLLYGVTANDPATYAGVALLLFAAAIAAGVAPALRAMNVNPAGALREE